MVLGWLDDYGPESDQSPHQLWGSWWRGSRKKYQFDPWVGTHKSSLYQVEWGNLCLKLHPAKSLVFVVCHSCTTILWSLGFILAHKNSIINFKGCVGVRFQCFKRMMKLLWLFLLEPLHFLNWLIFYDLLNINLSSCKTTFIDL